MTGSLGHAETSGPETEDMMFRYRLHSPGGGRCATNKKAPRTEDRRYAGAPVSPGLALTLHRPLEASGLRSCYGVGSTSGEMTKNGFM